MPAAAHAAPVKPAAPALQLVEGLRARSMGVDRAGNLWAWEPGRDTVTFITPAGGILATYKVSGARAVDADAEWGVLALLGQGRELRLSEARASCPERERRHRPSLPPPAQLA